MTLNCFDSLCKSAAAESTAATSVSTATHFTFDDVLSVLAVGAAWQPKTHTFDFAITGNWKMPAAYTTIPMFKIIA